MFRMCFVNPQITWNKYFSRNIRTGYQRKYETSVSRNGSWKASIGKFVKFDICMVSAGILDTKVFHETLIEIRYPAFLNSIRNYSSYCSFFDRMNDRERSVRVMSNRIVQNTRKQYEGVLKRFQSWLMENYPSQISDDRIVLPLDENACLEFLGFMTVKRNTRGVALTPTKSNSFSTINKCCSAIKHIYTESKQTIPDNLSMLLSRRWLH